MDDMETFELNLSRVRKYIEEKRALGRKIKEIEFDTEGDKLTQGLPVNVGAQEKPNLILKEDTFVELGNPSVASCAFVLWSDDTSHVKDGRITLIGPDIQESKGESLPFGQILIVGGIELKSEHYLDLERIQFASDQIEGYMLRSIPRRVWSRVSKEAAARGFSFETLGRALMTLFSRKMPLIQATEVLFVTSSKEDVNQLDEIATTVRKFSGELKKLILQDDGAYECTDYRCTTCDNQDVCDAIREWIVLRRKKTYSLRK
jgi:CO dehydrogenase/acetyl-CoA synthase beta subunit